MLNNSSNYQLLDLQQINRNLLKTTNQTPIKICNNNEGPLAKTRKANEISYLKNETTPLLLLLLSSSLTY